MTESFEQSFNKSQETFASLVEKPLEELLQGSIFSIEADRSSQLSQIIDQSASADLIIKYRNSNIVSVASSRIHRKESYDAWTPYPSSPTFRNSVNGSYENTELNKLNSAVKLFRSGVPVVLPRYLCSARVYPNDSPTGIFDLIAVETVPFIEHCFSPSGLNLPKLRMAFEESDDSSILLSQKNRWKAGIRTPQDGKSTFLFAGKKYLELNGLPFLYRKFEKRQDPE